MFTSSVATGEIVVLSVGNYILGIRVTGTAADINRQIALVSLTLSKLNEKIQKKKISCYQSKIIQCINYSYCYLH